MRAMRRRCVPSRRGCVGWGAERTCRPRRRARVGSDRGGGENPKKRCGGRAAREREGEDRLGADGWIDKTGRWGAELMKERGGRRGKRSEISWAFRFAFIDPPRRGQNDETAPLRGGAAVRGCVGRGIRAVRSARGWGFGRLGAAFAARGGVFVKIFSLARGNRTLLVVTAFLFSLAVHHRRGNVRRDCDVAGRCVHLLVDGRRLGFCEEFGSGRGRKESEEKLLEGSVRAPHVIR